MGMPALDREDGGALAAVDRRGSSARRARVTQQGFIHLALLTVLALMIYPAVALLIFSFKNPLQWDSSRWTPTFPLRWQNYLTAWDVVAHYLYNTTLVATVSTVGMVALTSLTAFAFARLRFPGRELFYFAIVIMLTVPTILNLIPQFVLYHNLGLINTRWSLIIQYIVQGGPFSVFLLRAFFQTLPEELFESARIDGCNVLDLYWRICVPLSIPILGTLSIISVNAIWNDYIWPTVAISDDNLQVLTVGLVKLSHNLTNAIGGDPSAAYGPEFAAYTIGALPILVLFVFTSRYYIEGLVSSGLKL